jgi:hypothetical protein
MTWTAPMTAVSGSVFTAAQFNTFVRDNLLACPAALATTPGSFFTTSGSNQLAERVISSSVVDTNESTTSGSFVDLATPGPSITASTGTAALSFMSFSYNNTVADGQGLSAIDISGATTSGPIGTRTLRQAITATGGSVRGTMLTHHSGLTPGTNTFKMMYFVNSGTGSFSQRVLTVIPL